MSAEAHSASWWYKLDVVRKFLVSLIWIAVIAVILATVGKYLSFKGADTRIAAKASEPKYVPVADPIPYDNVDKDIVAALHAARQDAEAFATREIDAWNGQLMQRVDNDFLDWYFGYWNQTKIGLKGLYHEAAHWVFDDHPTASEEITEEIQSEFANRVLRPQIAQLELERIARETMNHYVTSLQQKLQAIPDKYKIPQADWERYLNDIAVLSAGVEGSREVPLSLKTLYASGAGGAVLLASKLNVLIGKIGGKVMAKSAGSAAAQVASKTGAKVAAKAGGKLLGPIIGIGILLWDAWDHNKTKEENMPIMRQNFTDYFVQLKDSLLHDPQAGIMTTISEMEGNMVSAITNKRKA